MQQLVDSKKESNSGLEGVSFGHGLRRPLAGLAAAGALFGAGVKEAEGAVMLAPGTTLPGQAYIDYGAQFADSMVAIKTISPSGTVRYGSGVQIDERHVLTAAHSLDSLSGFRPVNKIFITTGVNFFSPEAEVGILRYSTHPTYIQGSGLGTGSQIDLAIVELSSPLINRGVSFASTFSTGATLSLAGFGQYAVTDGTLQLQDGYLRAFQSSAMDASGIFDNYFYDYATPDGFLPGKGADRDSGGGVFYQGGLAGLMVATDGGTSSAGLTVCLDVTTPEVQTFINDFRIVSVPEPEVTSLFALGLATATLLRRRK